MFNSYRLSAKTWKCPDWRCIQNEDGVKITFGTENYLFSLFCMKNYFVWETPSSKFTVVDLKVPFIYLFHLFILPGAFVSMFCKVLTTAFSQDFTVCNICKSNFIFDKLYIRKNFTSCCRVVAWTMLEQHCYHAWAALLNQQYCSALFEQYSVQQWWSNKVVHGCWNRENLYW